MLFLWQQPSKLKIQVLGNIFFAQRQLDPLLAFIFTKEKYTLDILLDTGLSGSKLSKVSIEQNHTLPQNDSSILIESDAFQYRQFVGRLIYLTVTRPDLTYSIQVISQFLAKTRLDHLNVAYMVRYLKGSPGQGIFMAANSKLLFQLGVIHIGVVVIIQGTL